MKRLIAKLKKLFTMSPEDLKHAEVELKCIFGIEEKKLYPNLKDLYPDHT